MKGLTDIACIPVGHAFEYDRLTACTAMQCETGSGGMVESSRVAYFRKARFQTKVMNAVSTKIQIDEVTTALVVARPTP